MYFHIGFDHIFALATFDTSQCAGQKVGRMAVFESYAYSVGSPVAPRVGCDEVHFGQMESAAVLLFCVVSAGYIDYIFVYVLADNKPWAAAEPEAFSLSDGMEPVAAVLAEFTAGFYLYYRARALAEVPADEIVVVYFPEEADALRVASECVRKLGFGGDATYIGFRNVAEGEGEVCQLFAGDRSCPGTAGGPGRSQA